MASPTDANTLLLPTTKLMLAVLGATAFVGGLAAAACWLADVQPATSGVLGMLAALVGAGAGGVLWMLNPSPAPVTVAMLQVAAAGFRMMVGLGAAVALALTTSADRPWLLGVFLVASIAGLVIELVILTPILRAVRPMSAASPTTSPTTSPETAA